MDPDTSACQLRRVLVVLVLDSVGADRLECNTSFPLAISTSSIPLPNLVCLSNVSSLLLPCLNVRTDRLTLGFDRTDGGEGSGRWFVNGESARYATLLSSTEIGA